MSKDLLDKVLNQAQTPVNIRSIESGVAIPISQSNPIDSDPLIAEALNRILDEFGVSVSVKNKAKNLLKFGRNPNVGSATTGYTIWYTGQDQAHETYAADNTNPIDSVSSNNAADTGKTAVIEGHTMSGNNRTFVSQVVTLLGQTRVPLVIPINRSTRLANSGNTNFVGEVYVYQNTALAAGKPVDTTKIHLTVAAGRNQSEKASTSLSSTDYWIVTGFRGSVIEKTAAFADVRLEIRRLGNVFREVEDVTASNSNAGILEFKPYLIIPANSDVRLVAVADGAATEISGSIQGFLAN